MARRMEELGITYPINPFKVITQNHWQLCTYTAGAHILEWESGELIMTQMGRNALSFYSGEENTFYIMYNEKISDYEFINFLLTHEIGHIFYHHIGPHRMMLPNKPELRTKEDIMSNSFAHFMLGLTKGKWFFPTADPRTYEYPKSKRGSEKVEDSL